MSGDIERLFVSFIRYGCIIMTIVNIFMKLSACVVCTYSSRCHKCANNGFSVSGRFGGKAFAWAEWRKGF